MPRCQVIYLNAENSSGFFLNQFIPNKVNNYLLDSEHFKMLLKNIITAFALTGLATATPVSDIEERQTTCTPAKDWCCSTAYPLSIFFIRGVGSNCRCKAFLKWISKQSY
jgi:hypothetical protein